MTTSPNAQRRALPRPDPDSLLAALLLAFLTTAGLFYVNILAALVDGLKHALAFSARDAGLVASANVYGAAAGSLIAALVGPRLPWRPTAVAVLLAMTGLDLGSMLLTSPAPLLAVRFLHGLAGGLLVGVGISLIGRTKTPDRGFGVLLFLQFGLGGLGVIVLPRLIGLFGIKALFIALIAMSLATLAMVPFIPIARRGPADVEALLADLADAPPHHVVHELGVETGAFRQRPQHVCRQVRRVHPGQRAVPLAQWRAHGLHDHCIAHVCLLSPSDVTRQ